MRNLLEAARRYLMAGMSVIPVPIGEKHPIIEWKEYQSTLATDTELREWFSKPNNIGILTGQISDLLVIDLDAECGLLSASRMGISSSVTVLSGRGRHFWYKMIPGVKNSQNKELGIDVRGEGGIVLVPPSIHPSGSMYRFLTNMPWEKRPVPSDSQLPILKKIQGIQQDVKEKQEGWIDKALEGLTEGNRHQTFLSILGRFRRDGYSKDDARRFLIADAERNEAIYILDEMVDKVWSTYNEHPRVYSTSVTVKSPQRKEDILEYEKSKEQPIETLKTGFPSLDRLCPTGLRSERVFTVAARTGTGKTNFAVNLARNLCEQFKTVLYFSTEFGYTKIWDWFKESMSEPEKFRDCSFLVCDSFSPSIEAVENVIREVLPNVFIFDHINHIAEETKPLADFLRGCNRIQRTYGAQGIVIAQLNRSADWIEKGERVIPRMSMIKGSGAIEQGSSRVLLLSEKRVTLEYNEILAVLDKNDEGDKGIFHLGLFKNPYRVKEIS